MVRRLVEQEQIEWPGRHEPGQFELAALPDGQVPYRNSEVVSVEQAECKERVGVLVGLPRPVGCECREQRSGIEGVVGRAVLT